MDGKAYMPEGCFEDMLRDERLFLEQVRDSYTGVIHLVSAAEGAEEFYTTANNTARRESAEEARALDRKTLNAWIGHPHLRVIDNSTDFEGKMRRLIAATARMLGIPVPIEIEHKFLLGSMPDLSSIEGIQSSRIEQIYLESPLTQQTRIRKRVASDQSVMYYRTVKAMTATSNTRLEREDAIRWTEYLTLAKQQEAATKIIKKTRYCFVYKSQYFELDVFQNPSGLILLERELTEENEHIDLPEFLDVVRDVTDEPEFSNYHLSRT